MKTLIFTRGNREAQQRGICEEYAKTNGLEVIGSVNNEKDLTVQVLGGGVQCVIVSEASRISRRRIEYIETEKMFNKFGVKLIAVGGTL